MARFGGDNEHFNSSLLTQTSPNLEQINLGLSPGPSSFMLFSNGALLESHHQTHFSMNLHGDLGEKEKNKEGTSRKRKRVKHAQMGEQKQQPGDVVHVRAKRGQATDSHSLAERVRREKINERLRCLQDLVPGCYKTMGMAVMLEVIIKYVRSLQNQIEFLSMKLSFASAYYDLNLEFEPMEIVEEANLHEAQEMDRILRESQGADAPNFGSTWPYYT